MDYYVFRIIYRKDMLYLWKTCEDGDDFLCSNHKLLSFNKSEELQDYCKSSQIYPIDEASEIIIPQGKESVLTMQKKNISAFCRIYLDLWNLAIDIERTFGVETPYIHGCTKLYNKIFRANNLRIFMAEKEPEYVPVFNKREQRQIKELLDEMYNLFDKVL